MLDIGNSVSETERPLQMMPSEARGCVCRCSLRKISIQIRSYLDSSDPKKKEEGHLEFTQATQTFSEKCFLAIQQGKQRGRLKFPWAESKTLACLSDLRACIHDRELARETLLPLVPMKTKAKESMVSFTGRAIERESDVLVK